MERRLLEYIDLVMGVIDGSRGVADVPIDSGCRINRTSVIFVLLKQWLKWE